MLRRNEAEGAAVTQDNIPDPNLQYQSPPPGAPSGGPMALSIVSLTTGILSCPTALLPICGCPVGLAGIICGAIALKGAKAVNPNGHIKGMATTGIILSSI